MIKSTSKSGRGEDKPNRPHSKGQPHAGRRRNYKLIVDPEIHGKQYEKQYRFDGHTKGDNLIEPRDPRKKVHFGLTRDDAGLDLPVPRFEYDKYYVGELPERQILLSNLNDNVDRDFLRNVCGKHGIVESVCVYSHPHTKRHLGLATVGFRTTRMAREAARHLDGRPIMGLVVAAQIDPTGSMAKKHVAYLVHPETAPKPSTLDRQPPKTSSVSLDNLSSSLITQMASNSSGQSKSLSYSQKFSMMLAGNPEIEPISPSPPHEDTSKQSDSNMVIAAVSPPPPPPPEPRLPCKAPLPPEPPPIGLALTKVSTDTRQPVAVAEHQPPLPSSSPPPLPSGTGGASPALEVNGRVSPSRKRENGTERKGEAKGTVMSPHGKTPGDDISQHSNSSGYNSATNGVTPGSGDDQTGGKTSSECIVSPTAPQQERQSKRTERASASTAEDMDVSSGSDSEVPVCKVSVVAPPPPLPPLPPLPAEPPPPPHASSHPPLPSGPPPPLPPLPPKSLPPPTSLPSLPVPPQSLPALHPSHMQQLHARLPFLPMSHGQPPVFFVPPVMHPAFDVFRHPPPMINHNIQPRLRSEEHIYRSRQCNQYSSQRLNVDSHDQKHSRQSGRSARLVEIEMKDKERLRKRQVRTSAFGEGRSQLDLLLDKVCEALKLDMLGVLKRDITKQLERCIIDEVESWWEKKTKEEQREEETEEPEVKSELGSLSLRVGGVSIKVDKNGLVTRERLPKMPSFLKRSLPVQPERLPGMVRRQESRDKGAKRELTVSDDDDDDDDDEPSAKRRIEDVWSDEDMDEDMSDRVGSESESERSITSESDRDSASEYSGDGGEETESELDEDEGDASMEDDHIQDECVVEPVTPVDNVTEHLIASPVREATETVDIPPAEVSHSTVTEQETVFHPVQPPPSIPVPAVPLLLLPVPSLVLPAPPPAVPVVQPAEIDSRQQLVCLADRVDDSTMHDNEDSRYSEARQTDMITSQVTMPDVPVTVTPEVEERQKEISPPSAVKPQYESRSEAEESEILRQFFSQLDEEDRKMMRSAFMQLQEENHPAVENAQWTYHPPIPPSGELMFGEWTGGVYRRHKTGCARCEGYYKISYLEKKSYLRRVNTASNKDGDHQQESGKAKQLSRVNRVQFRRVAAEFGTATSLIGLNQLDIRKKLLKFSKSSIHGWGLYALEHIAADEMVIEYVGEVVRNEVADHREKRYEQRGMGSSYMFRVDQEYVIDATHRGNFARFINHSCEPNCTAKVINVGSQKRIVIYSKRDISVNEEITYDYKFPLEEDKIHCLCGAPGCRGSLN